MIDLDRLRQLGALFKHAVYMMAHERISRTPCAWCGVPADGIRASILHDTLGRGVEMWQSVFQWMEGKPPFFETLCNNCWNDKLRLAGRPVRGMTNRPETGTIGQAGGMGRRR